MKQLRFILGLLLSLAILPQCATDITPPSSGGGTASTSTTCDVADAGSKTFTTCANLVLKINVEVSKVSLSNQSDDKVLFAGNENLSGALTYTIVRLLSTGGVDSGFGTSGILRTDLNLGRGFAQLSDGSLYVVGATVAGSTKTWYVEKYTAAGGLDTTYGTAGQTALATIIGGAQTFTPAAIAVQSGLAVVTGTVVQAAQLDKVGAIRLLATGAVDTSVVASLSAGTTTENAIARGMVIENDNTVVVFGNSCISPSFDPNCPVLGIRLSTALVVDSTFGTGGTLTTSYTGFRDAFVQATDGSLVALLRYGGFDDVQRFTAAGAIDSTFGSAGTLSKNVQTLVVDGVLRYLVIAKNSAGGSTMTRYTTAGKLDSAATTQPSLTIVPFGASLQSSGTVVAIASGAVGSKFVSISRVTPPN